MSENMVPVVPNQAKASLAESDEKTKNDDLVDTEHRSEREKPINKRIVANEDETESSGKRPRQNEDEVLDLARTMGLEAGDRLEVQWEIEMNGETATRWWGATLLEHDGRTEDGVAIRILDYDPFPEGGFPESSKEEVIFMGRDVLINYASQEESSYRLLTDDNSEVVWVGNEGIEDLVDTILTSAMQKTASNFNALPRAQQALFAEKVAEKKEKLVQLLKNHMEENRVAGVNRVLTARDAQSLLARMMMDG
jgi:hypothetical protein